jgi:hypothetical protein
MVVIVERIEQTIWLGKIVILNEEKGFAEKEWKLKFTISKVATNVRKKKLPKQKYLQLSNTYLSYS